MSPLKTRRGRPKGTGIDDTPMLEEIDSLIAANSELKPTTAIKALGITDPSTIRRLRDKYKEYAAMDNSTAYRAQTPKPHPNYRDDAHREARAMALVAPRDRTISEVVNGSARTREPVGGASSKSPQGETDSPNGDAAAKTAHAKPPRAPGSKAEAAGKGDAGSEARGRKKLEFGDYRPTPFDTTHPTPFTAWMLAWRHALKACQDATNLQLAATRDIVNAPATQILIRQQIAMSQMMLAMMPPTGFYPDTASILAGFPKR